MLLTPNYALLARTSLSIVIECFPGLTILRQFNDFAFDHTLLLFSAHYQVLQYLQEHGLNSTDNIQFNSKVLRVFRLNSEEDGKVGKKDWWQLEVLSTLLVAQPSRNVSMQ